MNNVQVAHSLCNQRKYNKVVGSVKIDISGS